MYGTHLYNCKVCSGTKLKQYKFGTKGGEQIVLCENCGLIFVNPIPDYESVVAAYSRLDTAKYIKEIESTHSVKHKYVARSLVDNLSQQFPTLNFKDYHVLDVGCGDGSLCSNLKDMGIQVMGQEIDKNLLN